VRVFDPAAVTCSIAARYHHNKEFLPTRYLASCKHEEREVRQLLRLKHTSVIRLYTSPRTRLACQMRPYFATMPRRARHRDATKRILSRESRCGQAMECFHMTREHRKHYPQKYPKCTWRSYLHQRCFPTMSLPLPATIVQFVHSRRHSSHTARMKYISDSKT